MISQGADQRPAGAGVSCDILARKKQARTASLFADTQHKSAPTSPAAPMAMVPAVAVPAVPAHFGGHLLRTFLNCRGGAGVAQRQRLGTLSRNGQDKKCADGGKPQNLRHVHIHPPLSHPILRLRRAPDDLAASPQHRSQARMSDVNVK
jgi:hypothetical protein